MPRKYKKWVTYRWLPQYLQGQGPLRVRLRNNLAVFEDADYIDKLGIFKRWYKTSRDMILHQRPVINKAISYNKNEVRKFGAGRIIYPWAAWILFSGSFFIYVGCVCGWGGVGVVQFHSTGNITPKITWLEH